MADKATLFRWIWLVTEIGFLIKICLAALGDSVIFSLPGKNTYKVCTFEFWQSSSNSFIRDLDTSILEIVCDTLIIVTGTGVFQKFQDGIIAACHPTCSVPRHRFIPEEPSKTLFGITHTVHKSRHTVQSFSQRLIPAGNHLDTTVDATLPQGCSTLENGVRHRVTSTGVASVAGATVMNATPGGDKSLPHDSKRYEQATKWKANVTCPFCGTPVSGLAADDRTTIDPCGHSAAALTTKHVLEQA